MVLIAAAMVITICLQDTVRPSGPLPEEVLFDHRESEDDASELVEHVVWLREHPFDLNTVRIDELETIPGVTSDEATAVIRFRNKIRRFSSVEQLAVMEDRGEEVLAKLKPFLMVGPASGRSGIPHIEIRSRISRSSATADSTFLGSPEKMYTAVTVSPSEYFRVGGVYAKDPGERPGDGFVSGYVQMRELGFLKQGIVGDFVMEAGQGLVFWRGSAFGKGGVPTITPRKVGLGAQPYRSSNEFNFFRGVAVTTSADLLRGSIQVSFLFSQRSLGATVREDGSISNLYESGLFRNEIELNKRHAVRERMIGSRVEYSTVGGTGIGVSYCRSDFDNPLAPDRLFQFSGSTYEVAGFDARIEYHGLALFGELARSRSGACAVVAGSILTFGPGLTAMLVFRDFPPSFNSLHARSFGEHTDGRNEQGMYYAWNITPNRWLVVSGFYDQFRFPWRTYLIPFPAAGHELEISVDASLTDILDIRYLYSSSMGERAIDATDDYGREVKVMGERELERHRLSAVVRAAPRLRFRGRVDWKSVGNGTGQRTARGNLISAEMRYEDARRFVLETGVTYFDTDSYDSRVSVYEHDIAGVFSCPSLYGQGRRWYVLGEWRIVRWLQLAAKFSRTERAPGSVHQASVQISSKF